MHRRLASRSLPSQDGCARPIVVRRSRGDEPPTAGGDGSGAADGSWQPATLARRVTQRPREPAAAGGGDVCERGSIHQASVCCRRRAGGGREGGRAGRGREHRTARGSIGIRAGSKPCNCPPPGGGRCPHARKRVAVSISARSIGMADYVVSSIDFPRPEVVAAQADERALMRSEGWILPAP